jgi:poly(A) polymerase
VMALLGIPPGPLVGKALAHLLELRLDRGPIPEGEAVRVLREWARSEGIDLPDEG